MDEEIRDLLSKMTLHEKARMCVGKDFWHTAENERLGIQSISMADGPHGLRKHSGSAEAAGLNPSVPATCFPTACASACSWDPALLEEIGRGIADECVLEEVDLLLGPGMNIKRSPLCGRNFEYFSEDPILSGEMAGGLIRGLQEKSIGTSLKHFAVNNQEKRRMTVNALVDERALREIYLSGFERAIEKSNPWTIMSAYNQVNGQYASENSVLLNRILKEEWGYEGFVMTDWGACNDRVKGLIAGQDLEMPGSGEKNIEKLVKAVEDGVLPEEVLNDSVERILRAGKKCGTKKKTDKTMHQVFEENHKLAERAALESTVLLKNEKGFLPFASGEVIGILGRFAEKPRIQGSGSSRVNAHKVISPLEALREKFPMLAYEPCFEEDMETVKPASMERALAIAGRCQKLIVFVGLPDHYEAEAIDREHMRLPESHNCLVKKLSSKNPNILVVLMNGAAVEMPWAKEVRGIFDTFLGGQGIGAALAKLITGEENPSGKLAESFPYLLEENSAYRYFPGKDYSVEYRESIFVGYRYYETAKRPMLFPFGHGLSYTTFEYGKPEIIEGKEAGYFTVKLDIKNTGERKGAEVVQLYIQPEGSTMFRPVKELKAFMKTLIEPGEEKEVLLSLKPRDFSYFSIEKKQWIMEPGLYQICIGSSIKDIRTTVTLRIGTPDEKWIFEKEAQSEEGKEFRKAAWEYFDLWKASQSGALQIRREAFQRIYGDSLPLKGSIQGEELSLNSPLADLKKTPAGKVLYAGIQKAARKSFQLQGEGNRDREFFGFVDNMPVRNLHMLNEAYKDPQLPEKICRAVQRKSMVEAVRLLKEILK